MQYQWSGQRLLSSLKSWLLLGAALGIMGAAAAFFGDRSTIRLMTDFLVMCVLVISLQVFVGNSGILSFGHVAFFGIGAYCSALVTIPVKIKLTALPNLFPVVQQLQFDLPGAVLTGALVAFLVALFSGVILARMTEGAMAMATLALLVMLHTIFSNWDEVTRGTIGLYGIPRNLTIFNSWLWAMLCIGAALIFKASPYGLFLQTTRDDPLAAGCLGISVSRVRMIGWVISALLTGMGGALWAQNSLAFGPNQFYYAETFALLSMLVIGGLGSITGGILGATVVTVLGELLREFEYGLSIGSVVTLPPLPGIAQMATALMIIIVLILRPQGLIGNREFASLLGGIFRSKPGASGK